MFEQSVCQWFISGPLTCGEMTSDTDSLKIHMAQRQTSHIAVTSALQNKNTKLILHTENLAEKNII